MAESVRPVVMSWSGGKDSTLALARLLSDPAWDVVGLLTTVSDPDARIAMHGVREVLLEHQAASLGLPLHAIHLGESPSNEEYETCMEQALQRYIEAGVRHVAFGDIYLEDVRAYRERQLARARMQAVFPVWAHDTRRLAAEFIDHGYRAVLTCVDTEQISGEFAGRDYDAALLSSLPVQADPCAENGEFHSFVHDGPIFSRPVRFTHGGNHLRDGRFLFHDLQPCE
ncbi:MAG: adenine nucleotide alpha hydrolase [Gammaproteobacteria bacterium]